MKTSLIFLAIIGLLLGSCKEKPKNNANVSDVKLSVYKDINNNFSLLYPSSWDTINRDSAFIFHAEHRAKYGSQAVLMINKEIMNHDVTLKWILHNMDKAITGSQPHGAVVEKSNYVTTKGQIYGVFTFDNPDDSTGQIFRMTIASFIRHNTIIQIRCGYYKSENTTYDPLFKNIIESFEFLPQY